MKTIKQLQREAKHLYRLCLVDGSLDEDRVRQVVRRVLESKQRGSLALLAHFRRLVKLDCARHAATVESVTPLPADLQTSVSSDLERVYGPKLSISFAENPTLIGGMRIKVGGDVYDSSVKARLAALERAFESQQ
jgi:F-type H+-transporting ATPase subunit delta